jgi:predicted nucleic-acid-binding Zn-ribbon protein
LLYPNSNNLFNMERISDNVSCPKCGNQFSVEQAITSEIRKVMQAEFDIKQHAAYESINKKKEEADQYLARATKWKQEQQEIINAQLAKQRETIEKDAFAKAQADASLKMQLLQTQVETGQQQLNELKQAELVFFTKAKKL